MNRAFLAPSIAACLLAAFTASTTAALGDGAAAERQYRIARRLAAEGSAEAAAALRKVVELDPGGSLADDAMLEEALLEGLATWPGELGGLSRAAHGRAEPLLRRIAEELPGADRAVEARYRHALLRLEPHPGQDLAGARLDLLSVATTPDAGAWSLRARYAIAWLDSQRGEEDRARSAYLRLLVDHPGSEVADRTRVGLARVLMRSAAFGDSASLLQDVLDGGGGGTEATELRDLAVRGALRESDAGGLWRDTAPLARQTSLRTVTAVASLGGGRLLAADRKRGTLLLLDETGSAVSQWALEDLQAVCEDPLGRILLAAGESVFRLDETGPRQVASQGRYTPAASIAADALGTIWIVDKRGDKIGRILPGGASPEPFWENREARVRSLAWDGVRLLAADERGARVLGVTGDGTATAVTGQGLQKPSSIAVDPAGQFAVLDGKTQEVLLFGPGGEVRDRISAIGVGVSRPTAISLGDDGSLSVADGSGGRLVRVP